MRTKQLFLILALLLTAVTGAWADNWDVVYWQTQTKQSDWTALDAGSTTGRTLGSADAVTYYYASDNLSFTNSTAGGSGLTILGTVYLYIPSGKTVTCTGANASGQTGAGAGIELTEGNTLYLLGSGTVNATGGNAANGGNGGNGDHSYFVYNSYCQPGSGGNGGNGGGGAGAGIGTRGGNGGNGGSGATANRSETEGTNHGVAGSAGSAGTTAGAMGTLYVVTSFVNLNASGGAAGSGGSGGARGNNAAEDPFNQYNASGGGGGGAGGFGGAASNIGTGGPGGGGGGGGAAGNSAWRANSKDGFYRVGAGGGNGGKNGDGSSAANGVTSLLTNPYNAEYKQGLSGDYDDDDWEDGNGMYSGGSGASAGSASTAGTANNVIGIDASGSYVIGSVTDWDTFAAQVTNGTESYSGKTLKLIADISVTTMAGSYGTHAFKGTFDGQGHTLTFTKGTSESVFGEEYCAPFRYVENATIQNLKTAGNVYTSQKKASGLVSCGNGTTTITGCVVGTNIYSTFNGDGLHGGFIASPDWYATINITGCVYTGHVLTNGSTATVGGFFGWEGHLTNVSISNSLYAPIGSIPEGWTTSSKSYTFVRADCTPTNCYYTQPLGTAQGKPAVVSSPFNLGSLVQDYGMLKAYEHGIIYNSTCYVDANLASAETGTENDPYTIGSTDDWNGFANFVTNGNNFNDKFVKLTSNISVSTMAGADDANSFQGTFDGDGHTLTFTKGTSGSPFSETYCAPFRHVKNSTIKNMHVDGTIYTSVQKAAGFVGESHGALNITNCHSSININSSKSGDGTHGGFVATLSGANNTILIDGCVFDGSFATTANTTNCGGFVGWGVYNKPVVRNSLMKPSSVPASMLINTFARWYTGDGGIYEPTVTNCYYVATDNLPTDQGKQTHAISAGEYVTISGLGAATITYDVSGITSYAKGIKYNSVYYAGNGENVSLTLSHGDKDGYIFRNYTASAGTLNGTTLTMPDTDVTINAEWMEFLLTGTGTSEDPYSIDNAEQWNNFADAVSIGYTFSGQYVKLNEDISVTEMVGTGENNSFQGTFLGNGKTLTFNKTISQNYYYSAPFRYVNGATIQDLKVKGDIYTYGYYTGGLVACCYGTTNIINCRIGSVIHNWGDDDSSYYYHSGFVAKHWSGALTITGCAFTGCLLTKDIYANMSGFVAYSQGTSLTITNSLFDPNLNVPMPYGQSVNRDRVFVLWSKNVPVTVTNSYYAYRPELGEPLGTRVYAIIPGDFVTVANAGAVSNAYADSELTFYTTGIQCGDALYAANGQNVSLTLGSQPNCQVTAFAASAGTLAGSGNPYTLTMPEQNVTIGATNVTVDNLQGGGTSENPYTISSADDWRIFSLNVANNNTYNGEYVKLMANISVSEMVGTSEGNSFKGTFLGNNKTLTFTKGSIENVFSEEQCAPFRYVNGATIQDLKVTGAIYTSKRHAGGLIAHCYNTTYITNCHVSTIIYNDCGDNNGRVRHGGIVGLLNDDSNAKLYIQGCSYTGRLLTDRNIEWCGGFVSGLNYYSHAYITNSLYAPGSIPSGWSTSIINSRTFNCGDGDITNCYHTETMGLIQGTRVLAFATAPANLGSVVHEYSMMTVYDNGILYDGTYYVTPTLPGSGTEQAPYTISSNEEWDLFANIVNDGFNNYNDKFVRLDESISVSTMVGTSDDRSFQGTFLGNNKTLTFTKGTSGSAFGEEYCAPFRYVKNATIQDLKVAGDIYTSQKFAAGLVAQPSGTTNITDCQIGTVIHSNVSGDGTHGGIVARLGSNTTTMNITGCVFNGRLLTNNGTHSCGGFVGWWDNKTANISNSLYAPDANITPGAGETAITDGATIIRDNNSAAYATCYFTETLGVAQGKQAYAFDSAPANLGSLVQNYGMVKAYANGILFDGTYYVAPASISLTDNSNNSTDISNADGYVANVTLTGRTLYKDGKWNTLCLPFNLVLAGSPLAGATARPLTSASITNEGTTLNLSFGTAVTTLVAGTPYIIKWEKASGYDEASEETRDLKAPAFSGVTISSDLHPYDNGEEKGDDRVRFLGTYESKTFGTTDNTILLMGAANTLYYPQSGAGIGAQRAYFKIGEDGVQARPLTAFSIDFGDGENNATGIVEADSSFFTLHSSFKGTWYDIQGRRIEGKPTQHGVYINNGRKVVIK